jgi:Zn-dependent oligopeptidase
LVEKLRKAELANIALLNSRQIFFATYDQYIHTQKQQSENNDDNSYPSPTQLCDLYSSMREKITHIKDSQGTAGAACWGHIFSGIYQCLEILFFMINSFFHSWFNIYIFRYLSMS